MLITFSACQGNKSKTDNVRKAFPKIVVEVEEMIYEYEPPNNVLVRSGVWAVLFLSAIMKRFMFPE